MIEKTSKISTIFCITIFGIVICLCFSLICYTLEYNTLIHHDQIYNAGFLEAQQGRYLSTFISTLLNYRAPFFFNIHPNDFQPVYTTPVIAFVVCLIVFLFTNTLFLFNKSKNIFLKIEFIISYLILFLLIYNNYIAPYIFIHETTIFFEYPFSIIFYVLFSNIIFKNVIDNVIEYKFSWKLLCFFILVFLSGFTVEIVHFPILLFLTALYFKHIIKNGKKLFSVEIKSKTVVYTLTYLIYIIAIVLYHSSRGVEHHPFLILELKYYYQIFKDGFLMSCFFVKNYLLLLFAFILIFKYKKINLTVINIQTFSTILVFFLTIFRGGDELLQSGQGFANNFFSDKYIVTLYLELLYIILFNIAYLFNKYNIKLKYEIIPLIIILIINYNDIEIKNYLDNIYERRNFLYQQKKITYETEKIAVTFLDENSEILVLPQKYYENCNYISHSVCFESYYQFIYPKFESLKEVKFDENLNYDYLFTQKELEELKFENLYKYAKELKKI